jgi:beta-lactamase superfamily II metal-dependent hydrolase
MTDFFEIDFLDVETEKSGDAIAIRYSMGGTTNIHVVDGGYVDTGEKLRDHIRKYYGNPTYINRVVVTHPDGDHANGLRTILEEFEVGELWMLRPWAYAAELLPRFERFTSVDGLSARLKEIYSNLAELESIAVRRKIPIREPFQGARIGTFTALSPSRARYLDLIVESERTPEAAAGAISAAFDMAEAVGKALTAVVNLVRSAWGAEVFSAEETSAENEMSVVQFANIAGIKILLTGDVGRAGLAEAADYAPAVGLALPGIDRFQVPHHGSRRNVSSETLDRWLGPRLGAKSAEGSEQITAIISSAKADKDHPRKSVVRACIHRGARVVTTEGQSIRTSQNAPQREGWVAAAPMAYPDDQEE